MAYRSKTFQGSNINLNDESADIAKLIQSRGVYDRHRMDWHNKFNRFGFVDPFNTMTTTREYIFFTKPELNLFTSAGDLNPDLKNQPFFVDAYDRYRPIMKQLQYSSSAKDGPFIPIISNSVTSGLDLSDLSAVTIDTADNVYGVHQTYRQSTYSSNREHDFSLEFEDTKYLEVYMLFRIYDEYEELKAQGRVKPSRECIMKKVLHDQMTAYKIVVGDDGMTILYYARLTGVFPLGTNRGAFSDMNNNEGQKISISFHSHKVRDMDPRILSGFNKTVMNRISGKRDLDLYDTNGHHVNGAWSSCPYVAYNQSAVSQKEKMGKLLFKWKE